MNDLIALENLHARAMSPIDALQRIYDSLTAADPLQVIDACRPHFMTEAISWVRSLPFWDEYAGQFTPQVLGIARVISKRAMTEFNLEFDKCGRVRERKPLTGREWQPASVTEVFTLLLNKQPVEVQYYHRYFHNSGDDLFVFTSPDGQPHPLSESSHWSEFAMPEAVAALGSPQEYAARLAEATLKGEEKAFDAVFKGVRPEPKRRKPKQGVTAAASQQIKPQQGLRFEEPT